MRPFLLYSLVLLLLNLPLIWLLTHSPWQVTLTGFGCVFAAACRAARGETG